MAEYVNSQVFLPDKVVHESILLENPVPSNVYKPRVIDDFLNLAKDRKRHGTTIKSLKKPLRM